MLRLRYYGDPALRRKAAPVREIDDGIRELARDMFKVMWAVHGVGLAGNQVGVLLRIVVIDPSAGTERGAGFALINPRVTSRTGSFIDEEGCLSFPGLRLEVRRPLEVRVEGLDLEGNRVAVELAGLLARTVLHELDHLDGVTFNKRLTLFKRLAMMFKLPKLRRKYLRMKAPTSGEGT